MPDITMSALHTALEGLSDRQRMYAKNIANVDTPGYVAGRVEFEEALGFAIKEADSTPASSYRGPTHSSALDGISNNPLRQNALHRIGNLGASKSWSVQGTRLNGANVNLDDEVIGQEQTSLTYQTVLEAMNAKYKLLRTAIGG